MDRLLHATAPRDLVLFDTGPQPHETFEMDWMALIYFRDLILLIVIAGGFHFRIYVQKAQKIRY